MSKLINALISKINVAMVLTVITFLKDVLPPGN